MLAILEPERELSLEDIERLGVSCMDVERRFSPARSGTHFDRTELLDVREERDAELLAAEDDLAFADLDHPARSLVMARAHVPGISLRRSGALLGGSRRRAGA